MKHKHNWFTKTIADLSVSVCLECKAQKKKLAGHKLRTVYKYAQKHDYGLVI